LRLPRDISGDELVRIAVKIGFEVRRQKGSHLILKRGESLLVIPMHETMKKGTLLQILRVMEISKEELADLL